MYRPRHSVTTYSAIHSESLKFNRVGMLSREKFSHGFVGFFVGLITALLIFCSFDSTNNNVRIENDPVIDSEIFSLFVTLKFHGLDYKKEFLKIFKPYAEYVQKNEHSTISYLLLQRDDNDLEVMLLERYSNKNAYLNIHKKTKEFLGYKEKFLQLKGPKSNYSFDISGSSYYMTGIGFI